MKLHIFKFSPRPRTAAAAMPAQVPEAVKEARRVELYALERQLFSAYAARLMGTRVEVLVERTGASPRPSFPWAFFRERHRSFNLGSARPDGGRVQESGAPP